MKTLPYLLIATSILCCISCEQTELMETDSKTNHSRITLQNTDDFYSTLNALCKMEYEEQMAWLKNTNIEKPLYYELDSCQDEVMIEMPRAIQLLFNKDLEMQINDTIVFFRKGNLFARSINGKEVTPPLLIGSVNSNSEYPNSTTRATYDTPFNKIGACEQYEFNIPGNKRKFKYVHELKSVIVTLSDRKVSNLFLRVKLEYKGRKWHEAGEARNINIHLAFEQNAKPDLNLTLKNQTKNYEYLLSTINIIGAFPSNTHRISLKGTIQQEVAGVPSTKKTNNWGVPGPVLPWS